MSKIQQLLNYQQKDSELLKIEQDAANSEERKKYVKAKNFLLKANEKLDQMENKALTLCEQLTQLSKEYEEIVETLKDFDHVDELVAGGADISFYKKNVAQLSESLRSLKAEINNLIATVKSADEDYKELKKKTISVQKEYKEYSANYQKYKDAKKDEMAKIKEELDALAVNIDPEILHRYSVKRSERIFPIICSLNNETCSRCGSGLNMSDKEKIDKGEIIECENCHRFLYKG